MDRNNTQSYVVMPFDEFNRALLVVILMFIVPCGCLVVTLLIRIYHKTGKDDRMFDEQDPTTIELISGKRKTNEIEDTMI